jgi:membrane-associated phospholipid phosphatase
LLIPLALLLMRLDIPVAEFCRDTKLGDTTLAQWIRQGWPRTIMRLPGEYALTIFCAVLLFMFHAQTWRAAGMLLLAGLAGAFNSLLKWVAGRSRPFRWAEAWDWDFFRGGWGGLINGKDLSFASGHATQAFAWAAAMAIALPRWRYVFYGLAMLTAIQRVASTDHYLTDVVVGAAIGVVTVRLLFRILSRIVPLAKEGPEADQTDLPRPQAD